MAVGVLWLTAAEDQSLIVAEVLCLMAAGVLWLTAAEDQSLMESCAEAPVPDGCWSPVADCC